MNVIWMIGLAVIIGALLLMLHVPTLALRGRLKQVNVAQWLTEAVHLYAAVLVCVALFHGITNGLAWMGDAAGLTRNTFPLPVNWDVAVMFYVLVNFYMHYDDHRGSIREGAED